MAFHLLGLDASALMSDYMLKEFAASQGLKLTPSATRDRGLPHRMTDGDKILQIINVAKLCDMPIREYLIKEKIHDYPTMMVKRIAQNYESFKALGNVYDYTDMLWMAKTAELDLPELEYLFIDEAQDLSALQWTLVNRLAEKSKHIIIAGDDKQAINSFAGADIDTFLTLPGKVETLEQSYRVPMAAFDMANNIVVKMTKYRKEGSYWRCRRDMGQVQRITSIPIQKIRNDEDWLILARSGYQLQPLAQELFRLDENKKGVIFNINGNSPVDIQLYALAQAWKDYREYLSDWVSPVLETDTAEVKECKQKYRALFSHFIKRQGKTVTQKRLDIVAKTPWYRVGDVDAMKRLYIEATLPEYRKKGNRLFTDAKVRLMTIHAAKGREATNVLLYLNLPRSVVETIRYGDSDTELKVLYVALTRTKKRLFLFSDKPQPYSYADLFT